MKLVLPVLSISLFSVWHLLGTVSIPGDTYFPWDAQPTSSYASSERWIFKDNREREPYMIQKLDWKKCNNTILRRDKIFSNANFSKIGTSQYKEDSSSLKTYPLSFPENEQFSNPCLSQAMLDL